MEYTEQLQNKQTRLAELLAPYYKNELELFDSPPSHHRA
ncbi:MAG: tRNA (uridine(54)-C5)-methyltransferase TrmA, partial [Sulfurovum sp.]|nr:tRNA (uridine(54)-C5)-methyltransferase TrmA [Sulfurovum sp.]